MAPVGESIYFPPLDQCLNGDHQLLSWKAAYDLVCSSTSSVADDPTLQEFLEDGKETLRNLFTPFGKPSSKTKSDFETKTAAINVTPTDNGHYNIEEIKEDAVWLSNETKIDELAALRVTVVEWQTRPATKLQRGSTEEDVQGVQDALGGSLFSSSQFLQGSSLLGRPGAQSATSTSLFESFEQRRLRLLQLYLLEKLHVMRVAEILIRSLQTPRIYETSANLGIKRPWWVQDVASSLYPFAGMADAGDSGMFAGSKFLLESLKHADERVIGLGTGSGWYSSEGGKLEAEEFWMSNVVAELICIMQLMLMIVESRDDVPSIAVVKAWYGLADRCAFLQGLELVCCADIDDLALLKLTYNNNQSFPNAESMVPTLQCLISVFSVAILKLDGVDKFINHASSSESPAAEPPSEPDGTAYLSAPTLIRELQDMFLDLTKTQNLRSATPAMLSWSVVALRLRNAGLSLTEGRNAAAQDGFEDAEISSAGRSSHLKAKLEDIAAYLNEAPLNMEDRDPVAILFEVSVDVQKGFEVIENLAVLASTAFANEIDASVGITVRLVLLALIRHTISTIKYGPEVVAATLSILECHRSYWDAVDSCDQADPVLKRFLSDEEMLGFCLDEAIFRYPYETVPILRYLKIFLKPGVHDDASWDAALQFLNEAKVFTLRFTDYFDGYELLRDTGDAVWAGLKQDIPIFADRKMKRLLSWRRAGTEQADSPDGDENELLPAGVEGLALSTDRPLIVAWRHLHQPIRYFHGYLSSVATGSGAVDEYTGAEDRLTVASEIIAMFASFFASVNRREVADDVNKHLNAFGDGQEDKDLISAILSIFELELQTQCQQAGADSSLDLLVHCLQFLHSIVGISPTRVWAFLSRSRLLDLDGTGGSLATIINATEMVTGRYDFLISCVRLFDALVESSVASVVVRKGTRKAVTRLNEVTLSTVEIPSKVMSRVLTAFERTLTAVFGSSQGWRYSATEQKLQISTSLATTFNNILNYVYGCDDMPDPHKKVIAVLADAGAYLVDTFLSTTDNDMVTQPILEMLFSGTAAGDPLLLGSLRALVVLQTHTVLTFSITLLRLEMLLDHSTSRFQNRLFSASLLFAHLYSSHDRFRGVVASVLGSLIKSSERSEAQPPSLLGHMGAEGAKNFLLVISNLSGPTEDPEVECAIWKLLSAVVSSRQQWFAIYILTGSTPRSRSTVQEKSATTKSRGKPLLAQAMDKLSKSDLLGRRGELPPELTTSILNFVATSQSHWPWLANSIPQRAEFLVKITAFINTLAPVRSFDSIEMTRNAVEARLASIFAKILAIHLRNGREMGLDDIHKQVKWDLGFFKEWRKESPTWNASLHINLDRNIQAGFTRCKLENFKRTLLDPVSFGPEYFYNVRLASKILRFDLSDKKGYAQEFEKANIDYSQLESQVELLEAWRLLVVELSNYAHDENISAFLVDIVGWCLDMNRPSNLPRGIFDKLAQIRVDLALTLALKLVKLDTTPAGVAALVSKVWQAILQSGQDFEVAFTGENAHYYRSLLRLLILTLKPHINHEVSGWEPIELLDKVVAKGFHSLAAQLHEKPEDCESSDIVLITAILQAVLRIRNIHKHHSQIALLVANNNSIRHATSLFSWSDQFGQNNDPIYGELSLLFLLELSTVATVAENMAVEGVLSQLSGANIMQYFARANGMGPFDEPTRLHSIWARGILPLCLNLIDAVGPPVIGEVVSFINQFPSQLDRNVSALGNRGTHIGTGLRQSHITLGMVSETHVLALLSTIVERAREIGPAEGIDVRDLPTLAWDKVLVKEDVDGWLQEKRSLRDRIIPANAKESELAKMKASSTSTAETRLEEKVLAELSAAWDCLDSH